MKILLITLLLSSSILQASVKPIKDSIKLVQDELFPYQWGLLNQGQTLLREESDIKNLPLKGVPNKDIGWKKLVGKFSEKRPIIAILDSGVDLKHDELQGNLWKNPGECGKDSTVDNDGNQLAGDCHGWNFTEDINSDAAKDPSDIDGHGTHIAGIIAALNNGTGMVGVTPNALIMPIKVMKDSNSTSDIPSSEAFALGIIYAVDNGADVINMSLGWPRALETKKLRDAVYYALGRGVPIVAAAGNNNSSEPLYPCAYDGVICVAASTVDGTFASFSNFGGHVDTIAPGEGILGLNPKLLEPEFFPVHGFEMRSGTSQSAPFVAGMIGALKANNPDLTIDELFAKLYQAPSSADTKKYTLGGDATWDVLNAPVVNSVVRPILKKIRQILFRGVSRESKLPLTIRNFGVASETISVSVKSLSKALSFESSAQVVGKLAQGEFRDLLFDVTLIDENAESTVAFEVTIQTGDEVRSYVNEIPVVRDLRGEQKFKKSQFVFNNKPLPVGGVRNGVVLPLISTLDSYGSSSKHEFFMRRLLPTEKALEITLFTREGDNYQQAPELIIVENAITLVNFMRVDLNMDGKQDYLIQTLAEKDEKKFFVFSFYDHELKPLWSSFQDVKLNLDLFVESLNSISFMHLNHPKLGKMMVPAFFTGGQLPKIDQVITSWDRYDFNRKKRLYYLEPTDEGEFRVRSLTTNVWEERVKKELKTKWFETVETEQVLPVSEEDAQKGQLRVLVSVGLGTKRQLFIHTFDTHMNSHGENLPQLVLQTDYIDPILSLTNAGFSINGEVYFNIYGRTHAKLVSTRGEGQVGDYNFIHESETDLIAGHIASFEKGQDRFSVFQTREELISVTNESKRSSRAKLRYSFLSQKLLSEMYYPVTYRREGTLNPALYVDATAVTGNRIYLFEEQQGELVASIKNSVGVPNNCKSLNPYFSQEAGTHEFIFLCAEENTFVIRSYEMN
jgi:hypothetical protein